MNDQDLERVLKSAGLREKPPADVERIVRERARAEWHWVVEMRRQRNRRRVSFALAAGIVAAAVGVFALAPRFASPPSAIATVALATGEVRVTSGWLDGWHAVRAGQAMLEGQTIETAGDGRGALALPNGLSARLDRGSRLFLAAPDRLMLERGTLYVDSGDDPARDAPLAVVTPTGTVRHVGTQYEVRLLDDAVQVSVRDGAVEWRSTGGEVERSRSGERLTISSDGRVERASIPTYGSAWDWTQDVTPAIDIEGLPLAQFLEWAARETGLEVAYASPEAEAEASGIVVHGSIAGLTPAQALDAVLATTSVRATAVGGKLVVDGR